MLVVIAIIASLAAIVIAAINPTRMLAQARNTQRRTDLNTIINAVYQYALDNSGSIPSTIPTTSTFICVHNASSCVNGVDLSVLTTGARYLVAIPRDPRASITGTGSRYGIYRDSGGRVIVSAPDAELEEALVIER
jgi:type IV pilus assembly protein PilA